MNFTSDRLSVQDICATLKQDFKARRMTYADVAEKIGTSAQVINNQMQGKRQFSKALVQKLTEKFGYSTDFLLFGTGKLYADGKGFIDWNDNPPTYRGNLKPVFQQCTAIKVAQRLLDILNNKVAIAAFDAAMDENEDEYKTLLRRLKDDYGYFDNIYGSLTPEGRKVWAQFRESCTQIETAAAKELIRIEYNIKENKNVPDEFLEFETEKFRNKVKQIVDAFCENSGIR